MRINYYTNHDSLCKESNGQTPLTLALEEGKTEIAELLRRHGAKE
mgnify:CR=1 FL=1